MKLINDKRWQDWCDKFLASHKDQMTEKQAENYLGLMLTPDDEFAANIASVKPPFGLAVFDAHARKVGLNADPKVRVLFSLIVSDRPGTAVMYVHALRWFAQKHNIERPLTMMDLHMDGRAPFAMGYPNEKTLSQLWDEQKTDTGANYLDSVG